MRVGRPPTLVWLTLLLAVAHGLGTPRPLEGSGAASMRHLLADDDQSGLDTALTATTRTLLQGNTPVCASTTSNGYACTQPIPVPSFAGSWSLSYSVSDSSTPPTNPCTATLQAAAAVPLPNGATNWMHFLLSTTTAQPGSWISLAFAAKPNIMGNSRAVLAGQQAAGSPFAATYALQGHFLPNADATPWAQNIGFATVGTATLLCFSKPVALASPTSGRRLAQANLGDVLTVGNSVAINVASGPLTSAGPQQHASQRAGTTLTLVPSALAAPTPSPASAPVPSPATVTKGDTPSPADAPTPSPASVGAPVPASPAPSPTPSPAPAPTPTPTPTPTPVPARTAASPSPAAVAAPGGLTADALNKASSCSADANGYACARSLFLPTSAGSWSLSYTVADTATPPTNPCTAALQAAASGPLPNGATHWMHFLLSTTSAPASSWIACAFAAQPNVMGNALAVLAGQQAAGSAPFVATYQLQTEALPDADTTPWAQNIGFATVGTTTLLCFSKPVALAASTSGRRLAQANLGDVLTVGSSLNLNVASGALTGNGPQQHSGRSRAGTTLTLVDATGTTTPTTPTTPAPSPSPAATPAPSPSAGATSASLITPDSLNAAPGCQAGPNLHGYQCNRVPALDRPFTLSYTASTSPVPPNNLCTQGFQQASLTLPQGANAWLHFMVTAQSAGWISMAFAREFNQMSPADAVIGWVDAGRGFAAAYQATDYAAPSQQDSPNWVYNIGASTTSDGRTALCFTRPALLPGFSGSSSGRRLSQLSGGPYVDISSALNLNFASAGGSFPEKHDFKQGISLDIASGASSSGGGKDLKYWVRAHGALMVAAFIFAMPTAILFARHKTLVPKVTLANKLIWFWLHMGLQLSAVVCFLAGIIIAWVHFEDNNIPTADTALSAHSVIGVIVLVLVGIQVLIGLIRPAPEHKKRWMWNLLHHNWGRVAVLLAWVNVAIGIYLWSELFGTEDNRPGIWRSWTIAVCVIAGVLLLVEVALDVVACASPRSSPQQDMLGATPSPSTDLPHNDVRVNMQQVPMAAIRTSPEAHKAPMAPHHLMAPRPQV